MKKLAVLCLTLIVIFNLSACCRSYQKGPCNVGDQAPCAAKKPCAMSTEVPCQKPCGEQPCRN